MSDSERFRKALAQFDAFNQEDPNREVFEGKTYPRELLYAQRMSTWLERLEPNAPEPLGLAARSQHIGRWRIARDRYPMDRHGYHQWRTSLAAFHAKTAGTILHKVGYDQESITQVQGLLQKKHLKTDPQMQILEDVICLVFLESYFSDFSKKHDEEKMTTIIQKTWKKMSSRGHRVALGLNLTEDDWVLLKKALGEGSSSRLP